MKRDLKAEKLCMELEEIVEKLFPEIRREDGNFQSGPCTIRGKKVFFLNKRQTLEEKIAAMANAIAGCNIEKVYLKPVIRAEVEKYAILED